MRMLLGLVLLLLSQPLWADPLARISEIRFEGNRITEDRILRQEMWVREGDELAPKLVERSRQAIMNLGLFRSVQVEIREEHGEAWLTVIVHERYYLLPVPLLGARPEQEEYSYGMELRYDNLFGLNQRLKLSYEHRRSIDEDERAVRQWLLDYRYPRLMGGRNNLFFHISQKSQDILLGDDGGYQYEQHVLSTGISRWLTSRGQAEGWQLGGNINLTQNEYTRQWGAGRVQEGARALEMQWELSYFQVAEQPYHRDGRHYGYVLTHALPELGSDFSYLRHMFFWREYRPLSWANANLNSQLRLGVASGSSFGLPAYNLGGGSLRGYHEDVGSGNAMLLLNLEYHHPISGYRQMRAVLFGDLGNVWSGLDTVNLSGFHPALGLGLRWKVLSLVDTTLRMDYGYGLRDETQRFYFSTSASF